MFVVGYTPGGAPYGIFEDEMDAGTDDLDMSKGDRPVLTELRAERGRSGY